MSQSGKPTTTVVSILTQKPTSLSIGPIETATDKTAMNYQSPPSTVCTQSPKSNVSPTDSALDDNMFKQAQKHQGQKHLVPGVFHVYTVKATDLRTGKSLENHKALLRKHIISKLDPEAETVAIGNMAFLSCSKIQLKIGDTVSDPLKKVVLVELLESTDKSSLEVKCLTKNNKPLTLADFEKCGSGHKARWFRFVAVDVGEVSHMSPTEMEIGPLRASCRWEVDGEGRASGGHRCFALTFSCETFDLTKIQTRNELPPQNVPDHFAASNLPQYIRNVPGFGEQQSLIFRGAYVIGGAEKSKDGIEYRSTLQASLELSKDVDRPSLTWKGCKATAFLPEMTVAEFLVKHFGDQAPCGLNDHQLAKASQFFKGVRVCVAVVSADRPVVATVQSLGGSARWNPESMFGTLAKTSSIECLRYPDLPCVNVGSEQRPFFYPAELCMIQPNQSYTGPIPLQIETTTFSTSAPVLKEHQTLPEPISGSGDPFMDVGETDFTFIFVQLVSTASQAGNTIVRTDAWKSFQHELGQRFRGKLASSVLGAKHFSGDLQKLRDHLMHKDCRNTGVKNVVIIAAPASIPRSELDTFKTFCDVKIGLQVQVVAAAEVNRRHRRDPENRSMVMYSGQVARSIFARALLPGRPDDTLLQSFVKHAGTVKRTGIFGINVQPLSDIPDNSGLTGNICELKNSYIITVVSAQEKRDGSITVPTTTTLFTVGIVDDPVVDFAQHVREALAKHLETNPESLSAKYAVIHFSGLPASSDFLDELSGSLYSLLFQSRFEGADTQDELSRFTLIAMTPESLVSIPAARTSKEGRDDYLALSPGNVPGIDINSHVGHLVLAQAYREPAGNDKAGRKLWHTQRRKMSNRYFARHEELLNKAREPSILQLAVKANKRGMGRVVKEGGEYKVLDVKKSLKGTLWYL